MSKTCILSRRGGKENLKIFTVMFVCSYLSVTGFRALSYYVFEWWLGRKKNERKHYGRYAMPDLFLGCPDVNVKSKKRGCAKKKPRSQFTVTTFTTNIYSPDDTVVCISAFR